VSIGDAAEIRTKRVRKQTDRQDAQLILRLLLAFDNASRRGSVASGVISLGIGSTPHVLRCPH